MGQTGSGRRSEHQDSVGASHANSSALLISAELSEITRASPIDILFRNCAPQYVCTRRLRLFPSLRQFSVFFEK